MDARISESIIDINKDNGVEGVLQVPLWASTYKLQSGASAFWEMVEKAASCLMNDRQEYMVLVNGHIAELQKTLGGNQNFRDGRPFIVGGECFFTFQPKKGTEWVSYAEALLMLGVQDL
ncbi:hypothetical protein BDZ45DRAFT_736177 [Acephala macrosclerotiorum]|nr:hypothetical protein BDZ45DRAFT_736177 [Acephala macrosclerotiorum]